MILTQKTLLRALRLDRTGGPLGNPADSASPEPTYHRASMCAILVSSAGLTLSGAAAAAYFSFQGRAALVSLAVVLVLIGTSLTFSALREKSKLDLIAQLVGGLSAESKEEVVDLLLRSPSHSNGGPLRPIESLLNTFLK